MKTTQEKTRQLQIYETQEVIEINGKTLPKYFMISIPSTSVDYEIICTLLEPSFISSEMVDYGGKDYVAGICYGLTKYDTIMREFLKNKVQTRLVDGKSTSFMVNYLDETKLKIILPDCELLRLASKKEFPFLNLKVPKYLEEYIRKRGNSDDIDKEHFLFWENLFKENEDGGDRKKIIAHYISWNYDKEIIERKADLFLPSVPYIKLNMLKEIRDKLLFYTQEINRISYNLYSENSAFYFVIDADLFIDKDSTEQINTMLLESTHKYILFKILNLNKISSGQLGYYGMKNFESFLTTLLNLNEIGEKKIIGMVNGGGFSYSLLKIVLNFFGDTVSNFPSEGRPRNTGRHRSLLHPISLVPERIEGVLQQLDKHNSLFLDDNIAQKYNGLDSKKFMNEINRNEWSIDARKMGILLWERLMGARLSTDKNKVFDEVINSHFSYLGGTLKNMSLNT